MKRMLSLVSMCALTVSQSAALVAQAPQVVTGAVLQANGIVSGTVSSSSGRTLSDITMQLLDVGGTVVGETVSSQDGDFTFPAVSYDTYTLQCVDGNKVIGTSNVILKAEKESVKITCTSDAAFWKQPGVLLGLAAAAAAIGATAVVAGNGDSGTGAVTTTTFDVSASR